MKKRILSFAIACLMVASTFIISKPRVDVHAVEIEKEWVLAGSTDFDATLKYGQFALKGYDRAAKKFFDPVWSDTALDWNNKLTDRWQATVPCYTSGGSADVTDSFVFCQTLTGTVMTSMPHKTYNANKEETFIDAVVEFTAPEDGIFYVSAQYSQHHGAINDKAEERKQGYYIVSGTTVIDHKIERVGGKVIDLGGYVTLKKGDTVRIMHTVDHDTETTGSVGANLNSVKVQKTSGHPENFVGAIDLTPKFTNPGTFTDDKGNVKLMGYTTVNGAALDAANLFELTPGTSYSANNNYWAVLDPALKNSGAWNEVSKGYSHLWAGSTATGLITSVGGAHLNASVGSALVFTAPNNGNFLFSAYLGTTWSAANGVYHDFIIMKNDGTVLVNETNNGKGNKIGAVITATVSLMKGEQVVIIKKAHDTAASKPNTSANGTAQIAISQLDYSAPKELGPNFKGEVNVPIIFDGTTFKDKLGYVELMGYKNGLYTEDLKIEIKGNEWFVYDTNGTNMWQGGGATQNYQWRGSVTTGALTHIGGHNNLKESGSALVFTAPADGTYKVDAALSSAWFNQTTRKAWSDYIIQKYDGTNYTTVTSTSNENKPDNTVTRFSATVTLSKGEQIIVIRKPSATAVTHNVASEGTATITITDLEHVCCADTLSNEITGQLPFCAAGVESYYQCYCGAYYADADAKTELVDNGHDWDDGFCADCGTECSHEGANAATCQKESVCPICAKLIASVNKNNHVHPNGAYVSNENGTHRYNRICCDYSDIASEKCTYGTDDICDKCGYDNTILGNATTNKNNAFDNVFNNGNNNVTVIGPADGLNDFATGTNGSNIDGVEYYMFNIHHDENGNVILRHHFLIEVEGVKIYVNGAEKALTAEGNNYYFLDTTPVLGKYDVADSIKVVVGDKTVTYTTSLYSYIKVALADTTGELSLAKIDYLKALYDLNEAAKPAEKTLVAMANQRGDMGTPSRGSKLWIDVYDISTGNMNTPIKSYSVKSSAISGFKYRNVKNYGDVLLIAGGTNGEIISCDTGATVWMTNNAPSNSHSIELMPNGVLAVAGSSGNAVRFFNTNGSDTSSKAEIALTDAHGALWDPEYDVLWVLGSTHLWALDVTLNADGTITVVKNNSLSVEMPMDHGHDLQPYYGHNDKLLITGETMKIYNKNTKEFTDVLDQRSTKAFCVLPNGDFIYMFPDGLHEQWNTTYVNILDAETGEITKIESNQGRFYKCRVWNYNYQ